MPIDERYEVIDENHGEGGFGKVSKRRDKTLDRTVAVKQLRLLDDAAARERFVREAKALARMGHPNVPAIYDVQFAEDEMYICFEFIDGQPLRGLIGSTPPSIERIRHWFMQVAAALEHAHLKGIIHRDIKPENIIISPDSESATLVDFGIALSAADAKSLTAVGYVIGTQAYMSPEQSRGDEIDGRSDLYSLGITLYEVLSGHLPYPGVYQSLSEANEAVPPAFDDLIQSCLAQDRNARIPSAQDFIKKLRSALRSDIPFSKLLAEARLHEIVAALRMMSAEEFNGKPYGQKLLLVNRLKDLIRTDRQELRAGTAEVIALLTRLSTLENEKEYRQVISAAFHWGFEKMYGPNWQGNPEIRESLLDTAGVIKSGAHKVLAGEFLAFLGKRELTTLPKWFAHDIRILVTNLLANPDCGGDADALATFYDNLNEATHKPAVP